MAELFDRNVKTIGKHIQTHNAEYYNLDVIISVDYHVKSQHGVEFSRDM